MLCGDDGVVVDFDLGIELNPIGEGAVGNPVFLLDFVVGFPRSIEVYDGFLEFRCVRILLFRGHLFSFLSLVFFIVSYFYLLVHFFKGDPSLNNVKKAELSPKTVFPERSIKQYNEDEIIA